MKIQGTPEEIEQAKNWRADQKRELTKNIKKPRRKIKMLKKTLLLLVLKTKKELIAGTKSVFHKSKEIRVKSI